MPLLRRRRADALCAVSLSGPNCRSCCCSLVLRKTGAMYPQLHLRNIVVHGYHLGDVKRPVCEVAYTFSISYCPKSTDPPLKVIILCFIYCFHLVSFNRHADTWRSNSICYTWCDKRNGAAEKRLHHRVSCVSQWFCQCLAAWQPRVSPIVSPQRLVAGNITGQTYPFRVCMNAVVGYLHAAAEVMHRVIVSVMG